MDIKLFDEAFAAIPEAFKNSSPICAMVLGSGWNKAVDQLEILAEISYADIPNYGGATVIGHSGRLLLVKTKSGREALAFCGRRHWYEGAEWEAVVMPVELARRLGVSTMLITNAAGGIRQSLRPGDMVAIRDHLRLTDISPLRGAHNPHFGPRFPDQSAVYNQELIQKLKNVALEGGTILTDGVYAFSSGPAFETPAEIRAYGILGADLVGMSTVPEAMYASSIGMRVAAVSFVSNMAAGISPNTTLSGDEVIECANQNSEAMAKLVVGFVEAL
ncbi:MAG: purine-nucleoside phosphorylase [Kiritimatiellae bacterium]|nr:purine-nucleoside phosphorylase [Kiritimatiellia bacterium]